MDFWCIILLSILVLMFVVVKLFILFFYEFKIKVVVVSVYIVFIGNIMFGVIKMLFYFGLSVC